MALFLGVLYLSGYLGFALLGGYGVSRSRYRLTWGALGAWTLWNVAWFTVTYLAH